MLMHKSWRMSRSLVHVGRPFRSLSFYSHDVDGAADAEVDALFSGLVGGKRASLARGITLVESTHPGKKAQGQSLLSRVMRQLDADEKTTAAFRIGLTGPPGAGKSTFIESFGSLLTSHSLRVAVLAVDPTSQATGGSLMGDKTRMPRLAVNPLAYIRPSPSGGSLGGVARNTNEAIVLCEGAGYDVILVETMGVGQSEYVVADMVDIFCLLLPPAGGDELQGLKRGIMEMADLVLVNKCDGDLIPAGRRVATEYTSALKFIRPRSTHWKPKVLRISSREGTNLDTVWSEMSTFRLKGMESGELIGKRQEQEKKWLRRQIRDEVMASFMSHPGVKERLSEAEERVSRREMSPGLAADMLLKAFNNRD